ncbi:AbrB/MazE/SpoVT family DNA-binding domain-containing protein [Hazenella sp. IB182357]|uniref:AbrB/MazE/SpoVT family DNA-binding domain-containing protein n=1 Tax=Polycladospora coralii TaxID=2771432 RepID=A0A926RXG0_9BACL|nr:AbrB/MazE/SpoVT family DNA-binding domain-containing protein [Polycladospora coralii]MBD1372481.1 AbrB/MazE/SpoVT family DNA-binding domain-containing protein [Polycladospora coralii]MBS7531803.1 AbrB/MazE/SpoVT family DNA-binding domain-containing protein [Polycladospora coralii]
MLKSTGIVRKVDELGRVVIPIELRRTLGIGEKDALEIYVDGERIVLKKYEPACIFTGDMDETIRYKNKVVSKQCIKEMYELLEQQSIQPVKTES